MQHNRYVPPSVLALYEFEQADDSRSRSFFFDCSLVDECPAGQL